MVIFVIIHLVTSGSGTSVHHITASPGQCPTGGVESCLNISTLARNPSRYSDPNTTLIFSAGDHILDTKLIVSNSDILRLSSNGSLPTNITCHISGSLEFTNISQIQITALRFIGCSSRVGFVQKFVVKDSSFLGSNDSSGSALQLVNVSDAKITRSSFTASTVGTYRHHVNYLYSINCLNG